jgi:hypothetical protein
MPVEYEIEAGRDLLRTRCVGAVTFAEVLGHFRSLEADPALPKRLDVLLDLGEITALPEADQVEAIADAAGRLKEKVAWRRCAIFAPRDVVYGVSRMFAAISEPHFRETMVFRRLADAERWLDASGAADV